MFDKCVKLLSERGVELSDIADCVMYLQKEHHPEITREYVLKTVETVIAKREVQHAILTGISLDVLAEQHKIPDEEFNDILLKDFSLYGLDEVLAYGIVNLYGSIAMTNFGFIDRQKPCIIGKLNSEKGQCNTFLDDIVGAIAASAASRIAHNA
jgi:phosphatidylglycerophosphatase A